MKHMKKALAMLLALCMILSVVPFSVFAEETNAGTTPVETAAETTENELEPMNVDSDETNEIEPYATGNVIDAAIFCSDVHNSPSTVATVFGAIKSADPSFAPSTASFVGDTECQASSVTTQAQSVYSDIECYYAYGSHDSNCGIDDVTGVLYNGANYAIYAISQSDMESYSKAQSASANFASDIAEVDASKPLFVISHMPLHARRSDNDGAGYWCDAINAAAASRDIVFFWAHNHTGENSTDTAAYYLAKGSSITVEDDSSDSSSSSKTSGKTLAFTYMNAGFIGKSAGRGGYVTTVKIYDDAMVFQDYNSSGAVSDNSYTHNVEIARAYAGSTDSGDDGSTETTDPTEEETTAPTEGEDESGTATVTYNYTSTASTDGTGYILVSNGYALQNNGGTIGAVAVTVSDDGSTITFDESVDVSTILWTIDSDGDVMNDGYYLLRASGSGTKSMTISTTDSGDAYSNWTYSDDTLTTTGGSDGSTTFYAYCDGGTFSTQSSSSQELKFYVPTGDTSSGGGSGDSSDGGTDEEEGGSTDTTYGEGTYTTADDGSYQKVTFKTTTTGTETKTVYVLASGNPSGNVLIADANAAGTVHLVANDGGDLSNTTSTVIYGDCDGDGDSEYYIELTDATNELWTVGGSYTFENQDEYLRCSNGSLSVSSQSTTWSYSSNRLSYKGKNSTYYLRYNNGWTVTSSSGSASSIYFYVPTEVEVETTVDTTATYSVTASDIEHFYTADETDTETVTITKSVTEGTPDGSYAYDVVGGDDIITSIDENGVITFNGTEGTAKVKVSYTWAAETDVNGDGTVDANDTYTIWQVIDVTATSPYYTIDLHKQTTDDSGNPAAGDEITDIIAIKGVEAGDTYSVWAIVKYFDGTTEDGEDLGDVDDDLIEWTSSDPTVATVDPATGVITFTGKDGTVNITATYLDGNKPSDTITLSATASQYSVPADGTNDFPEYPNEGAIRYDKTATAVGNFSETGIAQVELSMTGVPYTTGSEIDVVLMLDMTGSMTDDSMAAAEAAALAFAKQIILKEDGTYNNNRISVQVFNKNGVTELWAMSAVTENTYNLLVTAIESASDEQASGGTPYSTALSGCKDILDAARKDGTGNDRQQFCVFVSDGTPTSYTDVDGGSDTTKKEYYSSQMQEDGVTVYGVYTSAAAGSTGSGGGSVNDTEEGTAIMQNVASSDDKVYVVDDYTDTSALTGVFTNIAMDILQAATDITVEDQITDEYTMIFDIPTGDKTITGVTNDFYIEFLKYTLDASTHERVDSDNDGDTYDDATSVTKLYLKNTNGVYSAAKDSTGTAYDAPVFAQTTIGDKGTLYYWTTDSSYASRAAVSYNDGTNTYYFIPYGQEANSDGSAPTGWYNMTYGGYASGTVNSYTNMSENLVIATPYFVYNASTKMLYWTVDKLDTAEYALRYFLYLDDSATEVGTDKEVDAATYPTNDHAYITYTNFRGNDCQQKFPIPQLTWNGAQVSYVFYLVNSAGQPINKSGQVVDFANATFVTDIYTKAVVWNRSADGSTTTGTGELSANWLASELLPEGYTIYDEKAGYELNVYEKADGSTIKNQFTIKGDTAANISASLNTRLDLSTDESTVSTVTTKVYNTKAGKKITGYGTYYSSDADMAGFDFANTTVAFAVVWEAKLVPDTVVVDFGLDVLINVVQNDLMQNSVTGIGLGNEAFSDTTMNNGLYDIGKEKGRLGAAALTTSDGSTISIENETSIRFHQNDMTFQAPVTFYYESPAEFYENSQKKEGYMYSSVTVIPATTIYYEDEFVTFTNSSKPGVITDSEGNEIVVGTWSVDGTTTSATQDQDRPGESQISATLDADNLYGYDSTYNNMSKYSMGSAHKVNVASGVSGMASFSFYGTGFDVISLTDTTTGVIVVRVYDEEGNQVVDYTVDNYYGYAYQDGKWVTVDSNEPNALYQVPVMKIEGLTYGKYTAKIVANYGELFDHTDAGYYSFYLDAIRIYDPTGNQNATANNAYVADGEGWPEYTELRNEIITAEEFNSLSGDTTVSGIVFIDGGTTDPDNTVSISDYTNYGPNNELYLAVGQAVAFDLNATATKGSVSSVQLGIKTVGGTGSVQVYSVNENGTVAKMAVDQKISTATDMYYDITGLNGKTVVIKNSGDSDDAIVSLTNIKVTYTEAQTSENTQPASQGDEYGVSTASVEEEVEAAVTTPYLLSVSRTSANAAVMSLSAEEEPEVEVTEPETTEPEETEPETTKPEETEPETTEPDETEPETTEPETEETQPSETEGEDSDGSDQDSGNSLIKIIKKLLGWLFG